MKINNIGALIKDEWDLGEINTQTHYLGIIFPAKRPQKFIYSMEKNRD
jgi:hypothetical protein